MDANKSEKADATTPAFSLWTMISSCANSLREYLEPEGLRIYVAYIGADGLERAISGDFTLVVLDVMLPQVEGFEALRRIRQKLPCR